MFVYLQKAKECYPNEQAITVKEDLIKVQLQDILDLTTIRLFLCLSYVVNNCSD